MAQCFPSPMTFARKVCSALARGGGACMRELGHACGRQAKVPSRGQEGGQEEGDQQQQG
jgi:hypothetical protein